MSVHLQELEQDPFDAEEFVERLVWRTTGGISRDNVEQFDPMTLHNVFTRSITELKEMDKRLEKRIDKLEGLCKDEEKGNRKVVGHLLADNQVAFGKFQQLDERINFVATKVVHLGDQLEGVNTPRSRAVEAQKLLNYFGEFMSDEEPKSQIFNDPFRLAEAADVLQKLYLIAQELPAGEQFEKAKQRIEVKYSQSEEGLINEFKAAHYNGDIVKMKEVCQVLSQFKGYNHCIEAFIEQSQMGIILTGDLHRDIVPVCTTTSDIIQQVFLSPESITAKFVLNVFHGKLQDFIKRKLQSCKHDWEDYLMVLDDLYTKTTKLASELQTLLKLGLDSNFMAKITKKLFSQHISEYIGLETRYLKDKMSSTLKSYYESAGHQKKQMGGIHDLRRDIQTVIGMKANINLGPTIENYGGETFLSQEVAINLLQESKMAFRRCLNLSEQSDMPKNAMQIFEVLVQYLCQEFVDYSLDVGLQAVPLPDPKSEPEIYFFSVVTECNAIFHLFERQFTDSLIPLVSTTPQHTDALNKKRDLMEQMEAKISVGLDRTLLAMTGYVRHILTTEQKKTDFKPEGNQPSGLDLYSQACVKLCKYVRNQCKVVRETLDGKNVDVVLAEFGVQFHRVVYEHLLQFQYNLTGATLVLADVSEYRKLAKDFKISIVDQLFDTLVALCQLLIVGPGNVKQVCNGDQLSCLEKSVLHSFVQLRADYKSMKLANQFK